MTKTELQVALAAATETNKRTAGVFLDTLSNLAYKAIKKNGEFVLPGFGKLVKQKRKARSGFNPKTQQKIKIPAKTVVKFRVAKAAKDTLIPAMERPAWVICGWRIGRVKMCSLSGTRLEKRSVWTNYPAGL
jgi:DNA-binding protein HU-beta